MPMMPALTGHMEEVFQSSAPVGGTVATALMKFLRPSFLCSSFSIPTSMEIGSGRISP